MVQWPRLPPLPGAPLPAPRKLCQDVEGLCLAAGSPALGVPWAEELCPLVNDFVKKKKKNSELQRQGEGNCSAVHGSSALLPVPSPCEAYDASVNLPSGPCPAGEVCLVRAGVCCLTGLSPGAICISRIKDPLNGLVLAFMWQWPIIDETDVTYNLLL